MSLGIGQRFKANVQVGQPFEALGERGSPAPRLGLGQGCIELELAAAFLQGWRRPRRRPRPYALRVKGGNPQVVRPFEA